MDLTSLAIRVLILAGVGVLLFVVIRALRAYFENAQVPMRFDRGDAGLNGPAEARRPLLVEFVSPFCYECKVAMPILKAASIVHGTQLAVIDAKVRPDLASKYSIRHTPTILLVDGKGSVRAGWLGAPSDQELEEALLALSDGRAKRDQPPATAGRIDTLEL